MKHLQCHKGNPKIWSLHKSTCRINAIYYWNLSLWNTSFGLYFLFRCKTGYCMWVGRNVALCIYPVWLFNGCNLDSITSTTTCIRHKQGWSNTIVFKISVLLHGSVSWIKMQRNRVFFFSLLHFQNCNCCRKRNIWSSTMTWKWSKHISSILLNIGFILIPYDHDEPPPPNC